MLIEVPHVVYGNIAMEQALPLVEAAASRGGRVLWIQGQQNHFVAICSLEFCNRLAGERMPIAHGHKAARLQSLIRQVRLERPRLTFGQEAEGGASADGGIWGLNFRGGGGGDNLGRGL